MDRKFKVTSRIFFIFTFLGKVYLVIRKSDFTAWELRVKRTRCGKKSEGDGS